MTIKWMISLVLFALTLGACSTTEAINPVEGGETSVSEATAGIQTPTKQPEPTGDFDEKPPAGVEREFTTDFSKHSISYAEILSGGPPKDGIPAIDTPEFITVEEASEWLVDVEPVIFVKVGDDARAYPIQIMIWHEIANDTVADKPLTITFCPLCNTAIVFEREVDGLVLDFGTTGRLRNSNLIMYDRQTESWWQQATGEAIVGELSGMELPLFPASIIAWGDFAESFPEGMVLSRETGFIRQYGRNPYFGYDDINNSPFLFQGSTPDQLPAMERVMALDLGGETVAYPYSLLSEELIIQDEVGGEEIVIFWVAGTASALDTSVIAEGRDVGTASAYSPYLSDERLNFVARKDSLFEDQNTGSLWNIFGRAIEGPLKGESLNPIPAINHFWFDWVAFKPETRIYQNGK